MIFYQEIVFCRQLTDFCAYTHNKSLAIDQTFVVEYSGLEPLTSTLPVSRSSQMS